MTIRENGKHGQVTAAEALLLRLTQKGMQGDSAATRLLLKEIEEARARRRDPTGRITLIERVIVRPGSVTIAVEALRMATKLDGYRDTARVMLEPWVVELALSEFGDCRLTVEEQRIVVAATRNPRKVRWPDWWDMIS